MERAYDALVVGSGFGGGIAACRLAEAAQRVCVLERGRRFGPTDFLDRPEQAPELLWHEKANPDGLFGVRLMRDVTVITAAGVGGGSLVYANVQLRAGPEVFVRGWPAATTREALDPWYDRTEDALQPRTTPAQPALPKVGAFAAGGRLAGREAEPLPIAGPFGEAREHPFSGVRQEGCQNLARCDIGCPGLAKNTVDITYLARWAATACSPAMRSGSPTSARASTGPGQRAHGRACRRGLSALGRVAGAGTRAQGVARLRLALRPAGRDLRLTGSSRRCGGRSSRTLSEASPSAVAELT